MKKNSLVEGEKRTTKFGRDYTIGSYFKDSNSYECIFPDLTKHCLIKEIKSGQILHPKDKTVYGVGFLGFGDFNGKDNTDCYRRWTSMIKRVHCEDPYYTKYKACVSICEEWYNFQNFAEWFYSVGGDGVGYDVDKDLHYIDKPTTVYKIYSPNTCHLLPSGINKRISKFSYNHKHTVEQGKFRVKITLGGNNYELGRFTSKTNADVIKIRTFISALQQSLDKVCVNYRINLEQIIKNYKDFCEN